MKKKKNLLVQVEKYLKRKPIAERLKTNPTYLSACAKRDALTPEMENRIIEAVDEMLEELDGMLEAVIQERGNG